MLSPRVLMPKNWGSECNLGLMPLYSYTWALRVSVCFSDCLLKVGIRRLRVCDVYVHITYGA